ncbi:CHSlike [Aspergillus parasiticus SU-1]|uniref:CHSlike n=1 Tax=Aspergillus parasiticus (strain ATCC 56775 / NRRL 5862 / SRRC 143 / SU-1) TaxID=1403190 RepID=A0A0F0IH46_ASPPU|nr:CHSlike [Aspergillus parasiticus SU-1]
MGAILSNPAKDASDYSSQEDESSLMITGLATKWPSKLIGSKDLEAYALNQYPEDAPWLQSLMKINEQTGIQSRAVVDIWDDPRWHQDVPPTAEDVDAAFRNYGVQLAKGAALDALSDSHISPSSVTHVVAVTATNAGSPGYDQVVARELGIPATAERVLLAGVGCAGGLAALRVASNLARAATLQHQEARILIIACEVCSIQIRAELHAASQSHTVGIGPALFGDGAAAMVLCNSYNLSDKIPRRFSVVDWRTCITPNTHQDMSYQVTSNGFLLSLSKQVPKYTAASLQTPFQSLLEANGKVMSPEDFDWAVHPGGLSIIKGAQIAMNLPDEALMASYEIYRTRGNASSVAVLAVLDRLRSMDMRKQDVIACSFGPGLTTEMALLKRWL